VSNLFAALQLFSITRVITSFSKLLCFSPQSYEQAEGLFSPVLDETLLAVQRINNA
jgi:hypothetical protein